MTLMRLEIGGAETHVLELSLELARKGFEVVVASGGGVYEEHLKAAGICHYTVPMYTKSPDKMLASLLALKKIIRDEKIDIVHAHGRIPAFLCGLLHPFMDFTFVTTAHWVFRTDRGLKYLSNWGEKVMAVSEDIKTYLMDNYGTDPKDIFVVSIMPCTAKKDEKEREQMQVDGIKDVDAVLTTRELARMIKRAGILFTRLPDEEFDQDLLGDYTGAGVIFGVTGGVMEAALRTVYFVLTGKEHEAIKFEAVRGFDGIREASLDINGTTVNVAIAHGMKNAKVLLDDIRAGKSKYHFIEIMGCPGGCIAGGGQPIVRSCFLPNEADDILDTYKEKRAKALYSEDERLTLRQSHNNPQIKQLYDEFLGEPNSHKAHELLHTTYSSRVGFND